MDKLAPRSALSALDRRAFLRRAACASVCAAPALDLLAGPAGAWTSRGFIGSVKPKANDPALAQLIRLLPSGIGVAAVYLNFVEGTREELQNSYATYEKNIAYLASQRCDTISIEGAPPFMILGPDGEARLVDSWKEKYKTDMFTSSQNQVNVLKALKVKKLVGMSEFNADLNNSYAKYLQDCGIGVAAMTGMNIPFQSVSSVPAEAIYSFIKTQFHAHPGADAVYVLGSGLDVLDIVAALEQDLGVPVVQPVAARVWEIQRRLHIHESIKGYGTLLETLPG